MITYVSKLYPEDEEFLKKIRDCEKVISPKRFRESDKNHSLFGRVLLGLLLSENYPDSELSFKYGKYGKPYLKDETVFFNISHSKNFVVCSLSKKENGCDIQEISPYNEKIPRRFFTEKENKLFSLDGDKNYLFAYLWTLKESALKMDGRGITAGLSSFCFGDFYPQTDFFLDGCYFKIRRIDDSLLAICSKDEEEKILFISKEEIEKYADGILIGDKNEYL